jgi:hypothetical protein
MAVLAPVLYVVRVLYRFERNCSSHFAVLWERHVFLTGQAVSRYFLELYTQTTRDHFHVGVLDIFLGLHRSNIRQAERLELDSFFLLVLERKWRLNSN